MATLAETLALIDKVTGPARKMGGAIGDLDKKVNKLKLGMKKSEADSSAIVKGLLKRKKEENKAIAQTAKEQAKAAKAAKDAERARAKAAQQAIQGAKKARAEEVKWFGVTKQSAAGLLAGVTTMVGIVGLVAGKAFDLALAFGEGLVNAKLAREQSEALMNTLSGGRGAEVMDRLKTQSIALGTSIEELTKNSKAARDAGLEWKDAFKLNAMRADIIASGRSADEADTAISNMLDQVKKGTKSAGKGMQELAEKFQVAGDGALAAHKQATTLGGFLNRLKQAPDRIFDALAKKAGPQLDAVATKMQDMLNEFINSGAAAAMIEKIANGIDLVVKAVGIAADLIKPFWEGFKTGIGPALGMVQQIGSAIAVAFGGDKQGNMNTVKSLVQGLGVAIGFLLGQFLQVAAGAAAFVALLVSMGQKAYEAGAAVVNGLANGIRNGISTAVGAVTELVNRVKSTFTAGLKLGSPSRLFEDYGKFTGEGFVRGVEGKQAAAANATMGLGAAQPRAGARGAGAGGDVNVTIQVTAGAGATKAEGEALGSGIAAALRRDWPALFELKLLEAGV